jgi:hypothetical protein
MRAITATACFLIVLSGCLQSPSIEPPAPHAPVDLTVVGSDDAPIAFAQVTFLAAGQPVAVLSTDATGRATSLIAPPSATDVAVGAPGHATAIFPANTVPARVRLEKAETQDVDAFLRYRLPVVLQCPALDPPPYSCDRFGEPVIEVAGDGTIWYSATCCIGRSPPIWTSRDGGLTFQLLDSFRPTTPLGLLRDGTGIEGDFAIDDAGNVYFFDILAGAAYFTSYTKDGTHRWTVPQAWPPLVDRPWVRAGKADTVWAVYNTGFSTRIYGSHDGGLTWELADGREFPCGLGNFGQGAKRDTLYVAAPCGNQPRVWTSPDGGHSWDAGEALPLPAGDWPQGRSIELHTVPVADEAGNVYISYIHRLPRPVDVAPDARYDARAVYLVRRDVEGNWHGPFQVGPVGIAHYAWPAAGKLGHVGIAWYHAEGTVENAQSEWRLMTAVSVDADGPTPHFQLALGDEDVLARGPLSRQLGDFLQADLTPDGRLVVAYAKQVGRNDVFQQAAPADVQSRFVSTDGGLSLAPLQFPNGPKAA